MLKTGTLDAAENAQEEWVMTHTNGRQRAVAALLAAAIGLAGASTARAGGFPEVAVQPEGTASFAFMSGEQGSANKVGVRHWPFNAAVADPQFVSATGGGEPEIAVNAAGQT